MNNLFCRIRGILFCFFITTMASASPRLVVQITIDGLPTETVMQHADQVHSDGLGKFLREGTVYTGAELPYLTTFTAVGHASLFTGTVPAMHGMIGNEWLDSETGDQVYCVEDASHAVLDFSTKAHEGTSPKNLRSTTIGDELVRASVGKSRVFSVSAKDRGAILPGGKLGKAFWYSKSARCFVTSDYYYPKTPAWLETWRENTSIDGYRNAVWNLLRDREEYLRKDQDDRSSEKGLGTTFPHNLGSVEEGNLADAIRWTPFIDEMTLFLAREIITQENLGRGDATDMLCISFSAMDYVSHLYGPDSLEAEDTYYRVDALIAELLVFLNEVVGLENTLIVVSADHGFGRSPEQIQSEGLPAYRLTNSELNERLDELRTELRLRFGLEGEVVQGYLSPFLYLDRNMIAQSGNDLAEVQRVAAEAVSQWPGISWACTRTDLLAGNLRDTKFHERAKISLSSDRGGDVLTMLEPWSLIETAETAYPSTHGSPYAYDTHVPILFLGRGIPAQQVHREVSPLDIVPALAACLHVTPPPACVGLPLLEVVGAWD